MFPAVRRAATESLKGLQRQTPGVLRQQGNNLARVVEKAELKKLTDEAFEKAAKVGPDVSTTAKYAGTFSLGVVATLAATGARKSSGEN